MVYIYNCIFVLTKRNNNTKTNTMTTLTQTIANLTIGTIITYNDMANVDVEFIVLDTEKTEFGTYVNVMNLETKNIEPMSANTEIKNRWTL